MSTLFMSNNYGVASTTDYTITTGTANSQFPIENLRDPHTTKVFRSTGNTVEFTVDIKGLQTLDSFCLTGSSVDGLSLTACNIYLSPTNNFSGVTPKAVNLSSEFNFGYVTFSEESARYMRISLTGNGSYCELSNFYIGAATSFTNNGIDQASFKYEFVDNAKISKNKYNQKFINTYTTVKTLRGAIKTMNSTEFTTLNDLYKTHGVSEPIWVMFDSSGSIVTDGEYIFSGYYYFASQPKFSTRSGLLFDSNMVLEGAG